MTVDIGGRSVRRLLHAKLAGSIPAQPNLKCFYFQHEILTEDYSVIYTMYDIVYMLRQCYQVHWVSII